MTSNVSTTLRNAAKIAAFRSRVRTSAYHHVVKDLGLRAEDIGLCAIRSVRPTGAWADAKPWRGHLPCTALPGDARILIQVADRAQAKDVPPALPSMLGRIVDHMAALAERREIAGHAVARIVIEMRAGEHDIGRSHRLEDEVALQHDPLATR